MTKRVIHSNSPDAYKVESVLLPEYFESCPVSSQNGSVCAKACARPTTLMRCFRSMIMGTLRSTYSTHRLPLTRSRPFWKPDLSRSATFSHLKITNTMVSCVSSSCSLNPSYVLSSSSSPPAHTTKPRQRGFVSCLLMRCWRTQ